MFSLFEFLLVLVKLSCFILGSWFILTRLRKYLQQSTFSSPKLLLDLINFFYCFILAPWFVSACLWKHLQSLFSHSLFSSPKFKFDLLLLLVKLSLVILGICFILVCLCFLVTQILGVQKFLIHHFLPKYYPTVKYEMDHFDQKEIMLTIDDAPYTIKSFNLILHALKDHNLKAIFFVISDYVTEDNEHLLIRALEEGHRLENHGKTNRRHSSLSAGDLKKEIDACDKLLDNLYKAAKIVRKSKLYRPGCGTLSDAMIRKCKESDTTIFLGNNYPHDPFIPIPAVNFWSIEQHLEPGDIIIIHDRSWTPSLISRLGEYFKNDGYETVIDF